jgi:hypothetical protein
MVSSPSAVDLVEHDRPLPEQLEQGQEPRHHDLGAVGVRDQGAETGRPGLAQPPDDQGGLLAHADRGRVQVVEPHHGRSLRRHRLGRQLGELVRRQARVRVRQQPGEVALQRHLPGGALDSSAIRPRRWPRRP